MKWEEQLARVRRYHARFKEANDGVEMRVTTEYAADDMHAFFQNCYHLKDWLKNDPAFTKKTDDEIEDYITATPCLALCADICNGTKHLSLHVWEGGPMHGRIALKMSIEHNGVMIDAFTLATECLAAWEAFLS
jgi:hypothetical protein